MTRMSCLYDVSRLGLILLYPGTGVTRLTTDILSLFSSFLSVSFFFARVFGGRLYGARLLVSCLFALFFLWNNGRIQNDGAFSEVEHCSSFWAMTCLWEYFGRSHGLHAHALLTHLTAWGRRSTLSFCFYS